MHGRYGVNREGSKCEGKDKDSGEEGGYIGNVESENFHLKKQSFLEEHYTIKDMSKI